MKKEIVKLLIFYYVVTFIPFFSLHADTVVSGFTDKHIQKAIDLEYAKKGGVVLLPEGIYELRNAVYLKSGVQLVGKGKKTILKKCPLYSTPVIADLLKTSHKIFVEDGYVFKVGDGVSIVSETLQTERIIVTEILDIAANIILLKDDIPCDVSFFTQPIVYCSFPCIYCKDSENITIRDLVIDGSRQDNPVIDSWWDSGIGIRDSSNVDILNVSIIDSPGDGISLNNAHRVKIDNTLIDSSARLGVHVGGGSKYTYICNSRILNSGQANFTNIDGLYLCFDALLGLYENNVIKNNRGAGLSIGHGDSGNIFLNNISTNNNIGLFFREDTIETCNITFLNNDISNNHSLDLMATKPIYNIFMDRWPNSRSIHHLSSSLYCYDYFIDKWLPLSW
ncbi:MAG: hypothetical protein K1060chlam5_01162 [Candidatus Anoxychlamydiales bacterium]|nr:hypothetical protein [Candidatus Anoxychlamydiales bacterium]